jgi:hypothetical protein
MPRAPIATANDEGLEHAWAWFSHHSQQRFVTMNFYIVIAGAILAGAAALLKDGQQLACSFLGVTLAVLSVVFFLMDRRARRLVKIGEDALEVFQDKLATEASVPDLNLIRRSNHKVGLEFSYSWLFIVMYAVFLTAGVVLALNQQIFKLSPPKGQVQSPPKDQTSPKEDPKPSDAAPPPVKPVAKVPAKAPAPADEVKAKSD